MWLHRFLHNFRFKRPLAYLHEIRVGHKLTMTDVGNGESFIQLSRHSASSYSNMRNVI